MSQIPQKRCLTEKQEESTRRRKLDEANNYTTTADNDESSHALVAFNSSRLTEIFAEITRDVFPEEAEAAYEYNYNDGDDEFFDAQQALNKLQDKNCMELSITENTIAINNAAASDSSPSSDVIDSDDNSTAIIPVAAEDDLSDENTTERSVLVSVVEVQADYVDYRDDEAVLKNEPKVQESDNNDTVNNKADNTSIGDGSSDSSDRAFESTEDSNAEDELIDQLTEESPPQTPVCYSQRFPDGASSPALSLVELDGIEPAQYSQSLSFDAPSESPSPTFQMRNGPEMNSNDEGGVMDEEDCRHHSMSLGITADANLDKTIDTIPNHNADVDDVDNDGDSEDELGDDMIIPVTQSQRYIDNWDDVKKETLSAKRVLDVKPIADQFRKLQTCVKIWWFHAHEAYKQSVIFLFGKIFDVNGTSTTCTIAIPNTERVLYIEPRLFEVNDEGDAFFKRVTVNDVKEEVSEILAGFRIKKYKMDTVSKKLITPHAKKKTYIRLRYSYRDVGLPFGLRGKTFSCVYGIETSPFENFVINRKIMGPCWLQFQNVRKAPVPFSNSQLSLIVTGPDDCTVLKDSGVGEGIEDPTMTLMSLSLKTMVHNTTKKLQIIAASLMICQKVNIDHSDFTESADYSLVTITCPPEGQPTPTDLNAQLQVELKQYNHIILNESDEKGLIATLIAYVDRFDPDVIIGHAVTTLLDVLLERMKVLNMQTDDRLGRLRRRNHIPSFYENESVHEKASGRILCDTYEGAKEYIKANSLNLTDLAATQLSLQRPKLSKQTYREYYTTAENIISVANDLAFEAYASCRLAVKLQLLSITKQLTNISGNLWSDSLRGGRATRIEYLLLHRFHDEGYICPDKPFKKKPERNAALNMEIDSDAAAAITAATTDHGSYAGGLVLEPKIGYYDKYVLLLDFNSLYPTIIQEYNVCFTTMSTKDDSNIPDAPNDTAENGILPDLLRQLVEERKLVKSKMKDDRLSRSTYAQYDSRQTALKLTANSIYGCLGSRFSRFQARHLAEFITSKGRDILQHTVNLTRKQPFHVIYGDTDSVMIHTNTKSIRKARKIAIRFIEEVNKHYSLLDLDVDAFFRRTLLVKKKKYAALMVKTRNDGTMAESLEIKGLDMVRRDWCERSKKVSREILSLILDNPGDNEQLMQSIRDRLHQEVTHLKEYDLNSFIIRKHLSRNPEEYANIKINPHAIVASHMRKLGFSVKVGDEIPYVMCKAQPDAFVSPEPREPSDVSDGRYELDYQWYILKQILPPVRRLLAPISEISLKQLLTWLGVSADDLLANRNVEKTTKNTEVEVAEPETLKAPTAKCSNCNHVEAFTRVTCRKCKTPYDLNEIELQAISIARACINRYYNTSLKCNNIMCQAETDNKLYKEGDRCRHSLCRGKLQRVFPSSTLFEQLKYLYNLFDANSRCSESQKCDMHRIQGHMHELIGLSRFNHVQLNDMLEDMDLD